MHARDTDAALAINERSQKNRTPHRGQIQFPRRLQFGIVCAYRGRMDNENRACLAQLGRAMDAEKPE